jgi:hypothetical protein
MARNTLAVFTRPALLIDRVIAIVDSSIKIRCSYESPESTSGAGDACACYELATVSDVETSLPYCAKHARAVL